MVFHHNSELPNKFVKHTFICDETRCLVFDALFLVPNLQETNVANKQGIIKIATGRSPAVCKMEGFGTHSANYKSTASIYATC